MHAKASALLEAHTAHLLSQASGDNLNTLLDREVGAFLDWTAQRPLNRVVSVERIQDVAVEYVLNQAPTEALITMIVTLVKAGFHSSLNDTTYVHQLVEHKNFLAMVDKVASNDKLKKDLIHQAVGNPVYAKLLSDIVYHALSDYLVNENPLAKKVPGMSSLMKMGKGLMDSTGGNAAIESALRSYLHKNMQNIVDLSEKVLLRTLDAKQIHHVADQVWHKIKGAPLSVPQQYVKDADIDFAAKTGVDLWNHFRRTDYAAGMLKELIGVWFSQFAGRDGLSLLADVGLSRDALLKEIKLFAQPVAAELLASGFLEQRIRAQLTEFYGQEAVAAILG